MKKQMMLFTLLLILLTGCLSDDVKKAESKQSALQVQTPDEATEREMETQYLKFLSESNTVYVTNLKEIKNLLLEALSNPSLIEDEKWNQKVNAEYQDIEEIYHKLTILPYVPKRLENIHNATKEAFGLTVESKDKIIEGIKQNNTELINEGTMMIQESGNKFDEVTLMMKKIGY